MKIEKNRLTTSEIIPTIVSIPLHDFKVVFSSISKNELTNQKPTSFTWLKAVASPPAMTKRIIPTNLSE